MSFFSYEIQMWLLQHWSLLFRSGNKSLNRSTPWKRN